VYRWKFYFGQQKCGVPRLLRAIKASHWDVIAPCTHVVTKSHVLSLSLWLCHERTSPSTTATECLSLIPLNPRVRTAPFSTTFAPILLGVDRVNTLDTWKSSMRISSFLMVRVDFADMPGSYRLLALQRPENELRDSWRILRSFWLIVFRSNSITESDHKRFCQNFSLY